MTGETFLTGAQLVVRTLEDLGCTRAVGLPGQHALSLFDALGQSEITFLGARIEHNAGFAADGAGRSTRTPMPLLLSAGPGTLAVLSAVQEAHDASSPVLVIAAQVPARGIGGHRHGYLHELADQAGHYGALVKDRWSVRSPEQIPSVIAEAWALAASVPMGPVYVEIPSDVLERPAGGPVPRATARAITTPPLPVLDEVAALLGAAQRPVIYAGGGVVRADAGDELVRVAEALGAPVVTTFGGRSAFPFTHPLSAAGWIEDIATTELLESADVLLAVGTGLGELTTNYATTAPRGTIVQLDADAAVLGANYPVIGVHADAKEALDALAYLLPGGDSGSSADTTASARERIAAVLQTVEDRLAGQNLAAERRLLDDLRTAVPDDVATFFDMTILGYWSWSAWDARGGGYECAQSGGLGWALGAAMGSAFATGRPTLAVNGDGGAMYGISELATLTQHRLPVTWLIVDDGGYGVLREYLMAAFGRSTATELARPDFAALAGSFGIAARHVGPDGVGEAIAAGIASGEPNVVVVDATLALFAPTHLERLA
ncbi:thiamine pyrophosphate-binding protein [Microbacterium sp.]|uniref:thiamine pyrophosphate-binding protein n=1 Tax=Microbacterium sp. TaxID=51671 RepID=UPI003C793AE7